MAWKSDNPTTTLEEIVEQEETQISRDNFIAVVGLTFDNAGIRIEPKESIPGELLQDDFIFDWLLRKKAIQEL